MYTRLEDNMTKSYFRQILETALKIAKEDYEQQPNLPINKSFYFQLLDIKKTVINENHVYSLEDSKKKYPLGIMAIRNFEGYNDFDYKDMLVDISYGISRYPKMPEK